MNAWDELQGETSRRLEEAFGAASVRYLAESPMRPMLEYHYRSGGKRLRPLLTFAAALAAGRKQGANAAALKDACTPYALAVELTHNATLIHDDLQDEDRTRRGRETLWVKYSAAQAINCGDAWFFVPQLLIQDAAYAPELKVGLLALLQRKTLAVIDGQSQEFALKARFAAGEEIDVGQYLRMVEGKTSALFSMPLLGGASIAGVGAGDQASLESAAVDLGRAFQIQDDLLDLWGDKGRGERGSDIAEGKLSYPMVLLLHSLPRDSADHRRATEILRAPRENTSRADVEWVIQLMERSGVKEQAKRDFQKCLMDARASVYWAEVTGPVADWLAAQVAGF